MSGKLESVLDIRDAKNLTGFINLIKNFHVPSKLFLKAKKIGLAVPLIRNTNELVKVLASPRWRQWPMAYDVPSAPQIFGRIVLDAGIEGILYDSVLTTRPCIAIYPQNFQNSSAIVELDDPCPPEVRKRIDSTNFKNFLSRGHFHACKPFVIQSKLSPRRPMKRRNFLSGLLAAPLALKLD